MGVELGGGRVLHDVLWGVSPFLAMDLTVFSPGSSDMTGDGLFLDKGAESTDGLGTKSCRDPRIQAASPTFRKKPFCGSHVGLSHQQR